MLTPFHEDMAACVNVWMGHLNIFLAFSFFVPVTSVYYIEKQSPADCRRGSNDEYHQFFDISQLRCENCAQPSVYQTVTEDGLKCKCQNGMKLIKDYGGAQITCQACPSNQATSTDGWSCITCSSLNPYDLLSDECETCQEGFVPIERQLDGTETGLRTCKECASDTSPDRLGSRCTRCNQVLSMLDGESSCSCPTNQFTGGVCFKSAADLIDENAELYKVRYAGDLEVNSAYFTDNIRAARGMCDPKYSNLTACQTLSNMCVLIMYTRRPTATACTSYLELTGDQGRDQNEWPADMPWLYYLEDTATQILQDTRLSTQFTFPNSRLNFKVAAYTLNGTYLGMSDVTNGLLQLCKASQSVMDAAYQFGTSYSQSCQLSIQELWDEKKYPLVFYDMFIEYEGAAGKKQLYAVPVLIQNYEDQNGRKVNEDKENGEWQLVRRFFLVDSVSGRTVTTNPSTGSGGANSQTQQTTLSRAKAVRFAQTMSLHIALQEKTGDGKIFPPYLKINYGVARESEYEANPKVTLSFSTTYSMNLDKYNQDLSIAMGVLGALAVVYSFMQTWGWSKRAARINMDFLTIAKFVYFGICNIANVCFVVSFGASLWWLIFYKRQSAVYLLLPTADQEGALTAYIIVGFVLKLVQLVILIISQVTVDIFFIDWERPKGKALDGKGSEAPVSIWRTYFVANEWNEIQTTRKINEILQLFTVIFFLNVLGFENIASADPRSDLSEQSDQYYAPANKFFRFAISALIYIVVATVQWIFYTFIYERFIEDKVRQYVDLCSMSNVSVFILDQSHFGYYIHGRSVHGRADTDMREMHSDLKREEENLCGQRGLLPNTEQQTFQMAVPKKLRTQYDKVLIPINAPQIRKAKLRATRGRTQSAQSRMTSQGGQTGHIDAQTERSIQAYSIINRFLQGFIDHSFRDIDYLIKDKLLFESILDVEFQDASEKGIFYNDDGHSFDQVLFFGHEMTIIIFEILLFTIVDLIAQNFVLSAVVTYVFMELVYMVRSGMSENNLAKKTLVDKRFLI